MEANLLLTQISHTIELTDDDGIQYDVEVHCKANGQVEEIIITDMEGCYPEDDLDAELKEYIEDNLDNII